LERRHELPTHLGVEDHVLGALSMRQLLIVLSGLTGTYAAWSQLQALPLAARLCLATAVLLPALAVAFLRPGGRDLIGWALAMLRYLLLARVAVWRPRLPDRAQGRRDGAGWIAAVPRLAWADGSSPAVPPTGGGAEVAR